MEAVDRTDRLLWLAVALLLGLAVGAGVGGWLLDGDESADDAGIGRVEPFTVAEVVDDPDRYFRDELWLKGSVADVIGPRSFVLDGPADGLLVVSEQPSARVSGSPATAPLLENDRLWVRGELRVLDVAQLEEGFGAEFEDDLSTRDGDPVLVADEIQIVASIFPITGTVDAVEVADRPGAHIGKLAVVEGRVTESLDDAGVVLNDTLFVLNASGQRAPALGEAVLVLGPIRRFDLDQLPRGVRDDVDDDLFGDLRDRPLVVARAFRDQ